MAVGFKSGFVAMCSENWWLMCDFSKSLCKLEGLCRSSSHAVIASKCLGEHL